MQNNRRDQPIKRRVLLTGSIALTAGLLMACDQPPTAPVRVVAVTAATAEQAQPVLRGAGLEAVRHAAESDRGSFLLLVAGEAEGSAEIDLTARREHGSRSEVEHGPLRAEKIAISVARAAGLVEAVAARAGRPNLLQAMTDGVRGVPGTLLVLDSGLSTTDPLDLRALGWSADPAIVVGDLRTSGHLPELVGWDVVFSGLGRVAGAQPPLESPQQRWLEALWLEVCRTGGASSCTVDPGLALRAPAPASTRRAAPVEIPPSRTTQLADGTVEITIPDAHLGFGPGSADLAPGSDTALQPVLDAVDTAGATCSVLVTGFVAFWGTDSYRAELSQARADAVARWLADHGVPADALTAVGAGAADGPDASLTAGRFDESKVTRNGVRRVTVALSPDRP